jgi:hypothetical protein
MSELRVPGRRFYGEHMATMMLALDSGAQARDAKLDEQGWAGRRVLGYKLPEWQRREVWTLDQCVRFVESCYMGANIGSFMINCVFDPQELDEVVLDGQQRLRALERYWNNEFALAGEDGRLWLWDDLEKDEKARLHRIVFPWTMTHYNTVDLLHDAYNRHNYGGVAHTALEMAPEGDLRSAPVGHHAF